MATCAACWSHGQLPAETGRPRLIHSIPVGYTIDGSRGIRDPRGMFGERLGVDMHVVTAASGAVRNLQLHRPLPSRYRRALVVSPYAAGLALAGRRRDGPRRHR